MERHIFIEDVQPTINDGRFPIKRVVGEPWEVRATIFRDGADIIRAVLQVQDEDSGDCIETPMTLVNPGLDLWSGTLRADKIGRFGYSIVAWTDTYATWVREMDRKIKAGRTELGSEIAEGRAILITALGTAAKRDQAPIEAVIEAVKPGIEPAKLLELIADAKFTTIMLRAQQRGDAVVSEPQLEVWVERQRARYSTWYEFFVRSQTNDPARSGTFRDATERLPYVKELGFDVLYLTPIYPIGFKARKGKNNTVTSTEADPGSPWAIGNPAGGHTAIEPALGSMEDFEAFVQAAAENGIEIALDLAIQCSPDHPWVHEHPEWFLHRPDGTIKYAENPPKRYEDIYPINFDTDDKEGLWNALKDVVEFWITKGVRIFRVDNPHTKPLVFWQWLIEQVHTNYPDVIFLSEAFSRPPMMHALAKIGFTQSYTYFTWRSVKSELIQYLTELTEATSPYYFRPNFWTNTQDILPSYLHHEGQPAFRIRALLAATLSPSYGIYSGFEFCENDPVPGKEEYMNSEKYEVKARDWRNPDNISDTIRAINQIRRENVALQYLTNIRFVPADNDQIIAYLKTTPDNSNQLLIIVNLDPHETQQATVSVPPEILGLKPGATYTVTELLTGETAVWGESNKVKLNPTEQNALILRIEGEAAHG